MQDLSFIHISKWLIKGYSDYYFTTDKRLFNCKTNRFSKNVVRGYSSGYNLNGKFITKGNLEKLIFKVKNKTESIFDYDYVENDFLTNL